MSSMDNLFGPLSKQYCLYFYALSAVGLISVILIIVAATILLVAGKKENKVSIFSVIMGVGFYGLFYLQNRLLYNICSSTL
jgi:hypothetical protein